MKDFEVGCWYKKVTRHNNNMAVCIYKIISYNLREENYKCLHYCGHNIPNEINPRISKVRIHNRIEYKKITKKEAFLEIL